MHIAMMCLALSVINADFGICTMATYEIYPCAIYQNNQYYVFWTDYRSAPLYSLYGARVSATGTVIDPDGKFLATDSVYNPKVAFDGTNFLVVWREGC